MQKIDHATVLAQLFSAYPNSQATKETVFMYDRLLKDIPPTELQVVVDQAVAESEFLPTIARLRDMHRRLGNITLTTWEAGWEKVLKEIRRIGIYGTPVFDDEYTTQTVRTMGWRELCLSENQAVDRAQFRDIYTNLAARQDGLDKLLPQARRLAVGKMQERGLLPVGKLLGVKDGNV